MPLDPQSPALGGTLVLTAAAYTAFSLFAGGPLIADRTIKLKDKWLPICERRVMDIAKANPPRLQTVPSINCGDLMDSITGGSSSGSDAVCGFVDILVKSSPAGQIAEQNRKLKEAYNRRVENAARNAGSMCRCSIELVKSEDSMSWAIHAGSLRLIEPAEVRNRHAKLNAALGSPICAGLKQ